MKPNFALKLSHDGVEILQRAASGWIVTGSTRFDISDLDGKLRQLRLEAEALAPEGLRTKLIIPDSEVRYATVIAPGPTDEARRLQIEAEIEGLTPYALHELAYDYVVEGDHALVAICAREIMEEAEGFAQTHGFNPVACVAIPPVGAFAGEPFFGETAGARAFLSRDASVERDREPVRVVNQPQPAEPARPAPPTAATAKSTVPPSRPTTPSPARPAATAQGGPAPRAPEPAAAPEGLSRVGNLVRRMGTRIRREQAQTETTAKPVPPPATKAASATPAPKSDKAPAPATPSSAQKSGPHPAAAKPLADASAKQSSSADKAARPEEPDKTPSAPGKPAAPKDAKPAPVAFSSRRGTQPSQADGSARSASPRLVSESRDVQAGKANPGGRLAVLPASSEKSGPSRITRLTRRGRRAARSVLAGIGLTKSAEGGKRGGVQKRAAETPPLVPASAPPANEREKATEAEALTIFGARNMQRAETGFARRGLMLTGGLLLLLVAVAIWAVYFTTDSGDDIAQVQQEEAATLPSVDAPAQTSDPGAVSGEITAPAPVPAPAEEEAEPATQEPAAEEIAAQEPEAGTPPPATEQSSGDESAADLSSDPDDLLEELVQEALTEAMPVDLLGQTDDSATASGDAEAPGEAGETALGGIESPEAMTDGDVAADQRLALPPVLEPPQLTEVAPTSPPPPPPFGTEFELGPDGLVEATPEGAMTPTGVTVFAGTPAVVPPVRPAGLAPEAPAPAEPDTEAAPAPEPEAQLQPQTEADGTAVVGDDTPRADPALAGVRPQPRSPVVAERAAQAQAAEEEAAPDTAPEEAPEAPEADDDSAAVTPPPGGVLLDGLRPQRRPTDLVPPVETAADTATDTALDTGADDAPEVVARSLRPTARPSDISARVQESLAAARSAPAAAAPAPAASAAPSIPTSASVAQQATQARAINLRRVNLIGVFGTPNDRRALVRLSNGQVVRVQVGDRLDGGQVSAIGDNELRYVKNGRNEVLRIGSSG